MLKLHVSVSLDGYVAGPDVAADNAMGTGGEALHGWMFASPQHPADRAIAATMFSTDTMGAVIMGRRTLDVGLGHWGDDGTFGVPCFVVSHNAREPITTGSTTFTFVPDGLESAVEQARAAAAGKDVEVMGADLSRQLMNAGLIDELDITLVPIILGGGATLFGGLPPAATSFEQLDAQSSATVTHIRYRVAHR
ncbi:MAG: dihydrofolate reductase family protein [Ilumatobacteraceae bacterium]